MDLLKIVTNIGAYNVQLVREFIVNLPEKVNDLSSPDYLKVQVWGKCIAFSPQVINDFLGRRTPSSEGPIPSKLDLIKEISGGKDSQGWPAKGLFASSKLSFKYSILHKIEVKKRTPSAHSTSLSLWHSSSIKLVHAEP